MNLMNNIIINTFSIVILSIIFFFSMKHTEKDSLQHKLYVVMLGITIFMLIVDILSRFDGRPDTIYEIINRFGNFMVFLLNPIIPSIWFLYVHYQLFQSERKVKALFYPLFFVLVINTIVLVLSQFFGWYYYIDSNNIYHRGPLFLLSASITIAMILLSYIITVVNRKKIENKVYFSLMFFAVPPSICIVLQIIFYGTSLMLNSMVISLLIVFLNIQNSYIYIDYLTGLHNRKKLENYLKEKVSASTDNKTFSAILIDLNNFKIINDTFGHDMGDNALVTFSKLLRNCLRSDDFIARYGGDEFYIILDITDAIVLENTVYRIKEFIEKYNETGLKPYKLELSTGYAVYDYHSHMKVEEFQKQIDVLMYESKRAGKANIDECVH